MIDQILELKKKCNFDREIGEALNLKDKEISAIAAIAECSELTSKEVSDQISLSPSRGSRVITGLMEKGLVELNHNSDDRRVINITLTRAGEACYLNMVEEIKKCERRLTENLTEQEKLIISEGLQILLKTI